MNFIFKNLRWFDDTEVKADIRISNGFIASIGENLIPEKKYHVHDFKGSFLYPGLINSHDHLARNLFPKLGSPPYANYVEWAQAIYKPNEPPLREIARVSQKDLLHWGGIKNLISGVTTVVHHDAWDATLTSPDFPVQVFSNYAWAHSLAFEKEVRELFRKRGNKKFIIHAAEGRDALASAEIKKLDSLQVLSNDTIIIHGVAVATGDIDLLSVRGASLVWCPASNLFLFSRTAPLQQIKGKLRVSLGSDSTLTGSATFLEEIACAHKTAFVSAEELFNMVTKNAADVFGLSPASIQIGAPANLTILPEKKKNYFENLTGCSVGEVELVMVNGKIKYASAETSNALLKVQSNVTVNNRKAWINTDVTGLKKRIRKHVSESILQTNPLWNLIE